MKRILSIDGGGIRGVIPGQVLVELEKKLQKKTENPGARIADYFDFFAGTSTGGILSCIYLCPSENDPKKAKFSAQEAVDIYVNNGHKIFNTSLLHSFGTMDGMTDEKYNAAPLEDVLKNYFGDVKLHQLLKPCLIPSYDIHKRKAFFFTQHDAILRGEGYDFLVRDVCRATSAAPTYFETALIPSVSGVHYPLVDGGVIANNPALCAYSEVRNAKGSPDADDMYIVSIGTGSVNESYDYNKAKNWGAIGWIVPLIDIIMSGASEITDYQVMKMFSARGNSEHYHRVQPADMGSASLDMDEVKPENIQALKEVGIATAENCSDELDKIVDVLLKGDKKPDPVEFGK